MCTSHQQKIQTRLFRVYSMDNNKHMKRYSPLLVIRKMQIKHQWDTTSYTPEWLILRTNKQTKSKTRVSKYVQQQTLRCGWWAYKWVKPLSKTVWQYPPKLTTHMPNGQFHVSHTPIRNMCMCSLTGVFLAALSRIAPNGKSPKCLSTTASIN